MSKAHFAIGLDIGSGGIKGICAARKKETEQYEVFATSEIASFGVRKGVVEIPEKVSEKIRLVVKELVTTTGGKISSACININGSRIFGKQSKGNVVIANANEIITEDDMLRALEAAKAISLTPNHEVLDVFPNEYIVDNENGIKDPVGMKGTRLEADIMAVCAFNPHKKYLTDAVLDADVEVDDIIPSPLAAASSVLTLEQKELGTILIDFGAGTTSLAVFEEGKLLHVAIFPIGANNITNDIAIGLRTSVEMAERVKRDYKTKAPKKSAKAKKSNVIVLEEDDSLVKEEPIISYNHKFLEKIINSRMAEIFSLISEELKKIGRQGRLPGGAVLVGGGSKLAGISECCKKYLNIPTRIGYPQGFMGIDPDPTLAVLCGLVMDRDVEVVKSGPGIFSAIGKAIGRALKFFIP